MKKTYERHLGSPSYLDYFKVINDSLGHQVGDVLLNSVADRLREAVGQEQIVARFGGDGFILLLPDIDNVEDVMKVSDHILKVMEQPFSIYGQRFNISPSIGISISPEHGKEINTLIKSADLAMYHSKEKGRNCYSLFENKMKDHAMVRMNTEIQIRQALENNEFILHYQPKMDLNTGRIILEWKH